MFIVIKPVEGVFPVFACRCSLDSLDVLERYKKLRPCGFILDLALMLSHKLRRNLVGV